MTDKMINFKLIARNPNDNSSNSGIKLNHTQYVISRPSNIIRFDFTDGIKCGNSNDEIQFDLYGRGFNSNMEKVEYRLISSIKVQPSCTSIESDIMSDEIYRAEKSNDIMLLKMVTVPLDPQDKRFKSKLVIYIK